jgi:hypothetical protein
MRTMFFTDKNHKAAEPTDIALNSMTKAISSYHCLVNRYRFCSFM